MSKRDCGTCIVCCVYPRILSDKLIKQPMSHCPNLNLPGPITKNSVFYTGPSACGNCNIYQNTGSNARPACCEEYKCAWLMGHGSDNDRPDKSLILFDESKGIENALEAKPLDDKIEETCDGKDTINRMSASSGKPAIVLNFYEMKM